MKPRAALFCVRTLAHAVGGMQVHLDQLIRLFLDAGWECEVFTTPPLAQGPRPWDPGCPVRFVDGAPPWLHSRAFYRLSARAFAARHAEAPFDLIVSESSSGAGALDLPRAQRPPFVYFTHGFEPDHLANAWADVSGPLALLKFPLVKVPEVLVRTLLERSILKRAELGCAPSDYIVSRWERWYGVPREKLMRFANYREAPQAEPPTADVPRIVMAGTLAAQKGFQVGLRALALLARDGVVFDARIYGEGPHRETLEALSRGLGLAGRVSFAGNLPAPQVPVELGKADVFLMPTLRHEGVPFVVCEALGAGTPVVATDRAGNVEALGGTGRVVPVGDAPALAAALRGLLDDPELRGARRREARARWQAEFSLEAARRNLRAMLERAGVRAAR